MLTTFLTLTMSLARLWRRLSSVSQKEYPTVGRTRGYPTLFDCTA